MKTLERVPVSRLHPYYDEYGNAPLSRDYGSEANVAYVAELARSMRAKGEPDEPITVARDGEGGFSVIAGNSRMMAMRELGTVECDAVVLDDADAKSAVETAVRTDTKKKYEAEEASRLTQQLFLFGDDQYVSDVSGIDIATTRRVRRAREMVSPQQSMSLLRLAAIAELSDDEEAVEALTECDESDWERVAKTQRDRIKREREAREMEDALEDAGVIVLRDVPEGMIFVCTVLGPDEIPEMGTDNDPECAIRAQWRGYNLFRSRNAGDEERDAEMEAARQEREERLAEHRDSVRRGRERRQRWLAERLAELDGRGADLTTSLRGLATIALGDGDGIESPSYDIRKGISTLDELLHGARRTVGSVGIAYAYQNYELSTHGLLYLDGAVDSHRARLFTRLMDAMEADGYVPCGNEKEMYYMAEAAMFEKEAGNERAQ